MDEIQKPAISRCPGSFSSPIRRNPGTGSAECPRCGVRFDAPDIEKRDAHGQLPSVVPDHTPHRRSLLTIA